MSRTLVIVESPTKAKTIKSFLPSNYVIEASLGNVRDLPANASEIPESLKKEKWARIGVDTTNGFKPLYIISPSKVKTIKKLKDLLKESDELIIATDEDREGESIGWHLLEALKPKVKVKRMVFHEITKPAIELALANTRELDTKLVKAQEARRIIDRLFGYTLSPLLWKKVAPGLSAGRVQSVAVRVIVIRELERRAFRNANFYDLKAELNKNNSTQKFEAILTTLNGKRIATGKDFNSETGKLIDGKDVILLNSNEAEKLVENLAKSNFVVLSIDEKEELRKPSPPFITSTLQQESNRKLGLSARDTMRVAQGLYEKGFITYMRTDSVNLSQTALDSIRESVITRYGNEYLSKVERKFTTKSKLAQEAHEAIRPSAEGMATSQELKLSGDEANLYELIWKRSIATQMAEARIKFVSANIKSGDAIFRSTGRRVDFQGFFRAYVEGVDDPEAALEDKDAPLPYLNINEILNCNDLNAISHTTKPPARYTEATIIQTLEKEGVGRPSTYATIINTIQDRGYVRKISGQLVPTFTAMAVTSLLEKHFPHLVNLSFTAQMEETLDNIATGGEYSVNYLEEFYNGENGLDNTVKTREKDIDPREACTIVLPGLSAEVRVGKWGAFIETVYDGELTRASLPENTTPADLNDEIAQQIILNKLATPESIGEFPSTNQPIYLRTGPYGSYVQLGDEDKAKRTSLPKGITLENITLAQAISLLELPKVIGQHPETGKEIRVNIGRFGPYVEHNKEYASLKSTDNIFNIGLDRALELYELKKLGGTKRGLLRIVGTHPIDNSPIELYSGLRGRSSYIKCGDINAPIPKEKQVDTITLEECIEIIAERKANPPIVIEKKKTSPRKKKAI